MLKIGKTRYLGLVEASRLLGVSRATLWRAVKRGVLPAITYGQSTFVKENDVRHWAQHSYRRDMAERVRKRWAKRGGKR